MSAQLREKAAEAYAKGKFAKAAELYTAHCAKEPSDHQSRVRLGDAWNRAGRVPQAVAAYRDAAEGFAKAGFLPRAIAASKLILELEPGHAGVQDLLADLYAKKTGAAKARPALVSKPARTDAAAPPPVKALVPEAPTPEPLDPPFEPEPEPEPTAPAARAADPVWDLSEASTPEPAPTFEAPPGLRPAGSPAPPPAAAPEPRMRFDELELDVDAAAQSLWSAPAPRPQPELSASGDSLLSAMERAAELAGNALPDLPEVDLAPPVPESQGLPEIPLFSDLDRDAFIALFHRCPLRRVAAGERVISQGELGDAFYVVCAGKVRVLREEEGRTRALAELGEGAFFGEMALLTGAPRAASVEGASEETQLLEISAPVLADLAKSYPGVVRALKRFGRQRMLANIVETAPLFTAFDRSERKALVERFLAKDVQAGEVLIQEGRESDGLYVVLSGEVEVTQATVVRAVLREGELFGEVSMLTKAPAGSTVRARRRSTLLRLPRKDFDALITSHPQILALISEVTETRRKQGRLS